MIGFRTFSQALNSEEGIGCLMAASLLKRRLDLTPEDILGGDELECLYLDFERGRMYCLCKGETDEIELFIQLPAGFEAAVCQDISEQAPWSGLMGIELFGAWSLQNDRGYFDALQLDFGQLDDSRRAIIQIEAAASLLSIAYVRDVADQA